MTARLLEARSTLRSCQHLQHLPAYHTLDKAHVHDLMLQARGSTTRVDLGDGASLSCYRHVTVEGLLVDSRQGVYFEVSDEPDFSRKMRGRDKVTLRICHHC
jgi:hypothetical protein